MLYYSTPEGDVDTALIDQISSNPLWERLPAVQAGNVVQMDSDLNFASPGTAVALLDEIERSMLS
ncbi:MAG: hypothetical protein ABW122_12960 [Ilumatobacteraceae bacterium]